MDLSIYGLEDLLLAAMKSEIDSGSVYSKLASRVKNAFLKDRLEFLAEEEEKHKKYIEYLYKKHFPDKDIVLPEQTQVPLPQLKIPDESIPLSEVFESAMEAEMAAHDFYSHLAERFEADSEVKKQLAYLAMMEMTHYKLLELEKESTVKFETFDTIWPMMHAGP